MQNKYFKTNLMIALVFLVSIVAATFGYAEAEQRVQLPYDVQAFFASSRWKDWEVTGWVNPRQQKSKNACAFAAVKDGNTNVLVAFGWVDGGWSYQWYNPAALPQVSQPIVLGEVISDRPNFTSFYVYNDEIQEMFCIWEQQDNGAWELQELQHFGSYRPGKGLMFFDTSKDGVIKLTNDGWVEGKVTDTEVYGVYQRNLRYFSLNAFPLTLAEARERLSEPPKMPSGTLQAHKVKFPQGQKYPVYQGPGEAYARSGNGKASVSTNDWIQVFGEENGWLMIQYDITSTRMRIGWIKPKKIPQGANIPSLSFMPVPSAIVRSSTLTDDPLFSKTAVASVPEGATVQWLGSMGEQAYVEFAASGVPQRGFIPVSSLALTAATPTISTPATDSICFVHNPNPQDRLHLRSRPSTQAKSLGKYYNGVPATVLTSEKNGWVQVRIGSLTGYMQAKFLSFGQAVASAIPTVSIQNTHGTGLNLRTEQSTSSPSLGLYPNNTPVSVWGLSDTWCHVMTMDGKMGFMLLSGFEKEIQYDLYGDATSSSATYATISATTTLFKNTNPTDDDGITTLDPPIRVKVLRKGTTWTKVQFNDHIGYVPTVALNFAP